MKSVTRSLALGLGIAVLVVACSAPHAIEPDAAWRPSGPAAVAPATVSMPQLAASEGASDQRGQPEPSSYAESGPVRAEELRAAGMPAEPASLESARADGWEPSAKATYVELLGAFSARSPALRAAALRMRAASTRTTEVQWLEQLLRQQAAFAEESRGGGSASVAPPDKAPWPPGGRAALAARVVEADQELARAQFERAVLGGWESFDRAYEEAVFHLATVRVLDAQIRLGRTVLETADTRYRTGQGGVVERLSAAMRLDEWKQARQHARRQAEASRRALAAHLDVDPDVLERVQLDGRGRPDRPPQRETALALAETGAPSVRLADAAARRAEWMTELVERRLLPDLAPGVWASPEGAPPPAEPRFGYARVAPYLSEVRLGAEAARDAQVAARREAIARAESAWVAQVDAFERYALASGKQRRRTHQMVESARSDYESGRVGFAELDQVLRADLHTRLQAEAARRDAFVAAAALRTATGARPMEAAP